MVRVESILYVFEEENDPYIKIGMGKHGRYDTDSVCLTFVNGDNEGEIYLCHEQARKLSSLLTDWFMQKGKYTDD